MAAHVGHASAVNTVWKPVVVFSCLSSVGAACEDAFGCLFASSVLCCQSTQVGKPCYGWEEGEGRRVATALPLSSIRLCRFLHPCEVDSPSLGHLLRALSSQIYLMDSPLCWTAATLGMNVPPKSVGSIKVRQTGARTAAWGCALIRSRSKAGLTSCTSPLLLIHQLSSACVLCLPSTSKRGHFLILSSAFHHHWLFKCLDRIFQINLKWSHNIEWRNLLHNSSLAVFCWHPNTSEMSVHWWWQLCCGKKYTAFLNHVTIMGSWRKYFL